MTVDHVGYAVKRINLSAAAFEALGYTVGPVIHDEDRNIDIIFCEKDGLRVELVSPLNKTLDSPVDQYLKKVGTAPYHICYATDDLDLELARLEQAGYMIVIPPQPAVAFCGRRVAFLTGLGTGLMELVEQ